MRQIPHVQMTLHRFQVHAYCDDKVVGLHTGFYRAFTAEEAIKECWADIAFKEKIKDIQTPVHFITRRNAPLPSFFKRLRQAIWP